jgi:putative Ig domain-containing protein
MRTTVGSWIRFACCSVVLSASLVACGGGGGSGDTANASAPPVTPPVTTPVAPSNAAPTISGSAQTAVTVGQAYSFKPTAADADRDTVTFTISNKPKWAAFNATTGLLSGTPAASDVGTYAAVEVAATDGKDVTALPAFTITVAASAAAKSVSLAWSPPTQNDDGSTLTDLAGYKIHYGTASKNYTQSVALNNAGLTRYQLDSLPSGKIFIAMTAVNKSGAESEFSQELSVTVN